MTIEIAEREKPTAPIRFYVAVGGDGSGWVMAWEADDTDPGVPNMCSDDELVRHEMSLSGRATDDNGVPHPDEPGVWKVSVRPKSSRDYEGDYDFWWEKVAEPERLYTLPDEVWCKPTAELERTEVK